MANLILNSFSSFDLLEEEETQGSILTITQKQVIQNEIALMAEEKLNLVFDPEKPSLYTQEEAYKKGQLDALKHRLTCSDLAEERVRELNNPDYSTE